MDTLNRSSSLLLRQVRMVLTVVTLLSFGLPAVADELITLKPRPDATQSILLWEPHSQVPDIVFLLFPGGPGNVRLGLKDGLAEAASPHIFSRQREVLAKPQFAVAVIDAPSDQKDMDEDFRMSAKHLTDAEAVVREIRNRFPKARLVVIGHSRGTVSAGYVSRTLGDQVSAVVLLSGRYQRLPATQPGGPARPGLSELDLGSLKSPVLLVHHAKDACPPTQLASTADLAVRLPMITVNGNDEASTGPGPACGPGTNHWFVGLEKVTGEEVIKWLSGKEWVRSVP